MTGAVGFSVADGRGVVVSAGAVILATGGLTRLYRRNSASANMGGDGHALALRAGAELMDMEFVQFFPIGHLAPRLVGMDPIMWDPFRYKLGGRLLNAEFREFVNDYGNAESGRYNVARDRATHAILSEVKAGRGSPAGGAYLSFQHVPEADLRVAFGSVIDKLAANGIDLTTMPVEVAPSPTTTWAASGWMPPWGQGWPACSRRARSWPGRTGRTASPATPLPRPSFSGGSRGNPPPAMPPPGQSPRPTAPRRWPSWELRTEPRPPPSPAPSRRCRP